MTPTEKRLQLLRTGYTPLPLYGKEPPVYGRNNARKGFTRWSELTGVTAGQVKLWERTWPDARNTGVLTARMPTFDIDILHPEAAKAVEDLARERYEERGYNLTRIGQPPKRAVPFRTTDSFPKIVINLTAPDGSGKHKLEFLGDGQQVVVDGVHPDTLQPYQWHGGELGEVAYEDLPHITAEEARQLVDDAAKLLIDQFGFKTKGRDSSKGNGKSNGADPHEAGSNPQADPAVITSALTFIPNTVLGWDEWNTIGMATWRATGGSEAGFVAFDAWSKKSNKYDGPTTAKRWAGYFKSPPTSIGAGTILYLAEQHCPGWREKAARGPEPPPADEPEGKPASKPRRNNPDNQEPALGSPPSPGRDPNEPVLLHDFRAYMPMHAYIYTLTREMWPARSVNARISPIPLVDAHGQPVLNDDGKPIKMSASAWLDRHHPVEQMTWFPGMPMLIKDRLIVEGGWIDHPGASVFNQYRPPEVERRVGDVKPWLDHVKYVFADDAAHIIRWLAHCVQRPDDKINHGLVLGGKMGIGKDTLLVPVRHAVGPWNVSVVTPRQILGRFNGFLKCVILIVSEGRDLGEYDRFAFYDHMKGFMAAPPDTLLVDEKHLREHRIPNLCSVIITTNHLSDGIHLPEDDRRHYVAWSERSREDFADGYWSKLYRYFDNGGIAAVATYLADLDLTDFDAKAPPTKTPAFWTIVDASRTPEDAELADVLDRLQNPVTVTLLQVQNKAGEGVTEEEEREGHSFAGWLKDRKNRRKIPHRFECCGYVPVRNSGAKDGLWKIHGSRQVIYARAALSVAKRHAAANELVRSMGGTTGEAPAEDLMSMGGGRK